LHLWSNNWDWYWSLHNPQIKSINLIIKASLYACLSGKQQPTNSTVELDNQNPQLGQAICCRKHCQALHYTTSIFIYLTPLTLIELCCYFTIKANSFKCTMIELLITGQLLPLLCYKNWHSTIYYWSKPWSKLNSITSKRKWREYVRTQHSRAIPLLLSLHSILLHSLVYELYRVRCRGVLDNSLKLAKDNSVSFLNSNSTINPIPTLSWEGWGHSYTILYTTSMA
jgi:hypothetical protein